MDSLDARIARFAAQQHGVFSFSDAVRLGATERIASRRCASQRWERLYAGVYRLAGAPITWRQSLLAACLAVGEGAAVSHRAAAAFGRLVGFESTILEITVPRGRRPRLRGVIVHQMPLAPVDISVVDAIPITTPARSLLDLAAVAPTDALEEALDDALRRGLVTVPRLLWRLDELGRRPGATTMRRLLAARTGGSTTPRSVLETRFRRLHRHAGLPEPVAQYEIRDKGRVIAVPDFAYPEHLVAIEVDGYRWHSGRRKWQHDLSRRNTITKRGWRLIHVTDHDLVHRPEEIAATIAETLRL